MHVEVIATESLGDGSYVVHDGEIALVVDPQRDLDRVHAVLAERAVRVGAVAETHVHNDDATDGLPFRGSTGADSLVNAEDAAPRPAHHR